MKKYLTSFWDAVLAGICIAIGGTVFLSLDNKIIGAMMFSIGLIVILTNDLKLFTGKVGYALRNNASYIIELFVIWIGNFIGTFITAFFINCTRLNIDSYALCKTKLNDNLFSIFVLSAFCGMLMLIAVNGYKKIKEPLGKYIVVILAVAVFILCGFEHCIANMFYFSLANAWNFKTIIYVLVMTIGNAAGSFLFVRITE